jgi:hypothetical protein
MLNSYKFFSIINKDRHINSSEVTPRGDVDAVLIVGGPDYQKLTNNCKTYAMGVLKEVGIIEHETLSNFFIQRPVSCHNHRVSPCH